MKQEELMHREEGAEPDFAFYLRTSAGRGTSI